jgi:hypothetical protein
VNLKLVVKSAVSEITRGSQGFAEKSLGIVVALEDLIISIAAELPAPNSLSALKCQSLIGETMESFAFDYKQSAYV